VLFFPAEDSLAIVRQRLDGLAAGSAVALAELPLHVITATSMRLDLPADRQRLAHTVQRLQPVLLVLDPLIRLHQLDENDASQIAPLLGFLRQLQRQFHLAVLLVHHAKKDGASLRPGQALRGSSELHGWGDSNLYLRRQRDQLTLTVEHRAAPALDPIPVRLTQDGPALVLAPADSKSAEPAAGDTLSPEQRLLEALSQQPAPVSVQHLRKLCSLRTATVCQLLRALAARGQVRRQRTGYTLNDSAHSTVPHAGLGPIGAPSAQGLSQLAFPIDPEGKGNGKPPETVPSA
jgi:hypothetical protein